MKTGSFSSQELNNYISMAITGHYPLFDPSWFDEAKSARKISYNSANRKVKEVFSKISRHKTADRKKIAIGLMPEKDRIAFVRSFIKLVENNILEHTRTLQ